MTKRSIFALFCASALSLVGCGDVGSKPSSNSSTGSGIDITEGGVSGGGGFGAFDTGIDGSKTFDEVTDAEIQAGCDKFFAYVDTEIGEQELVEFGCTINGLFFGSDIETDAQAVMACEMARDQCVASPENTSFECPLEDLRGCTATVADAEKCFDAQVKAVNDLRDDLVCANATADGSLLESLDSIEPAICEAVYDSCDDEPIDVEPPSPDPGG